MATPQDVVRAVQYPTEAEEGVAMANPIEDALLLAGVGAGAKLAKVGTKALLKRFFTEAVEKDASLIIREAAPAVQKTLTGETASMAGGTASPIREFPTLGGIGGARSQANFISGLKWIIDHPKIYTKAEVEGAKVAYSQMKSRNGIKVLAGLFAALGLMEAANIAADRAGEAGGDTAGIQAYRIETDKSLTTAQKLQKLKELESSNIVKESAGFVEANRKLNPLAVIAPFTAEGSKLKTEAGQFSIEASRQRLQNALSQGNAGSDYQAGYDYQKGRNAAQQEEIQPGDYPQTIDDISQRNLDAQRLKEGTRLIHEINKNPLIFTGTAAENTQRLSENMTQTYEEMVKKKKVKK